MAVSWRLVGMSCRALGKFGMAHRGGSGVCRQQGRSNYCCYRGPILVAVVVIIIFWCCAGCDQVFLFQPNRTFSYGIAVVQSALYKYQEVQPMAIVLTTALETTTAAVSGQACCCGKTSSRLMCRTYSRKHTINKQQEND
jgi:hypothetical protein